MPPQTGKATGFNLKAATLKHKDNEPVEPQDFSNLPGGIEGGIAKVKTIAFGVYKSGPNQGKQFWRASGIVQSPRTAIKVNKTWQDDPPGQRTMAGGKEVTVGSPQEVVIIGKPTSIMHPLCDTTYTDKEGKQQTKPAADHVADMVNELKLLGEETFNEHVGVLDEHSTDAQVRAAYESLFTSLVDQGVRFKFSTRDGKATRKYPTPRTFETWHGTNGVGDEAPEDAGSGVVDGGTPAEDETQTGGSEDNPPVDDGATASGEELPDDLDELAAICDDNDDPRSADAVNKLFELAAEVGVDTSDGEPFQAAGTYAEAAEMVKEALAPQDEAPSDEPWVPTKGESCFAKVFDAKGKRYPKASAVEVVSVNAKAETVTLKSGVTGKAILDPKTKKPAVFKFAELSQEG